MFRVYVDQESKPEKQDPPAILGNYFVENKALRFVPRFPAERGLRYRAVFNPSKMPGHAASEKPVVAHITLPKARPPSDAVVELVYPTTNKLPENQLKFYIHFSAPMSRGESYRHLHLLDAAGKEVDLPFLELDEELWDPAGKRFTLFFDPGRIKRGLKPREEVGPVLEEGKSYALVIDSRWQNANGIVLKESYRKNFTVGPPNDKPPDPKTWKIETPPAGSERPLLVRFPKPMDSALLQRTIEVKDGNGQTVAGGVTIADEEKRWQFTPHRPWQAGKYVLVVDKILEDLAGNSIGRPFEVDVLHPLEKQVQTELVNLPFQIVNPAR